jgi:hypothetical protein
MELLYQLSYFGKNALSGIPVQITTKSKKLLRLNHATKAGLLREETFMEIFREL